MVLWGAATTLLYGQRPVVVSSGSMAPALDVGDLVVVEPYHGQTVYEGSVVVFDDEAGGRSIIHRVVDVHEDGTFTTGGDANRSHDSDPLTRDRIEASVAKVEAQRRTRDAYASQFEIGQRQLLDLLDAENELFIDRVSLTTAMYTERFAVYRVLAVVGDLLDTLEVARPREVISINRKPADEQTPAAIEQ